MFFVNYIGLKINFFFILLKKTALKPIMFFYVVYGYQIKKEVRKYHLL
jgi:hypothetical protein